MSVTEGIFTQFESATLVDRRPLTMTRHRILYHAPEFKQRLCGDDTVQEGGMAVFRCKVLGFPKPSLRWFKDDTEIIDHTRIRFEQEDDGSCRVTLDNVNKGDEAVYRCEAENHEGHSSSTIFLSVKAKRKRKLRKNKYPNRRFVSHSPLVATIAEKTDEEYKEEKNGPYAIVDPLLTCFYTNNRLNNNLYPPDFLGTWAFANNDDMDENSLDYYIPFIDSDKEDDSNEDVFCDQNTTESLNSVAYIKEKGADDLKFSEKILSRDMVKGIEEPLPNSVRSFLRNDTSCEKSIKENENLATIAIINKQPSKTKYDVLREIKTFTIPVYSSTQRSSRKQGNVAAHKPTIDKCAKDKKQEENDESVSEYIAKTSDHKTTTVKAPTFKPSYYLVNIFLMICFYVFIALWFDIGVVKFVANILFVFLVYSVYVT